VRIETAIGGGFGNPLERSTEDIVTDVADGYITRDDAEGVYGLVLDDELGVDEAATAARRDGLRHAPQPAAPDGTQPFEPRVPTFQGAS
jgi:hypothetical protein